MVGEPRTQVVGMLLIRFVILVLAVVAAAVVAVVADV
jgi:hypothetical protein